MRAWEITSFDDDGLKISDRPQAELPPGHVRIRMRAASLNYRDHLMTRGQYNPRLPMPVVPLSDGAGEVVEVGAGVSELASGDRVLPCFVQGWYAGDPTKRILRNTLGGPVDGVLQEEMVLPVEGVVPAPGHLSFEEAATLPCAALTAWSALVTHGGVKPGDRVVVLGTGGVSIFALQFARLLGAEVIATSSSDEKLEEARKLGATHLINYREQPGWEKEVFRLTGKQGADHVIEVGGAGTLEKSIRCVRPGGTISLIGVLAAAEKPLDLRPLLMQNIRVQGIIVGHRESFLAMNRAIESAALRPVVDRTFAFEDAPAALNYLREQRHTGKIAIGFD